MSTTENTQNTAANSSDMTRTISSAMVKEEEIEKEEVSPVNYEQELQHRAQKMQQSVLQLLNRVEMINLVDLLADPRMKPLAEAADSLWELVQWLREGDMANAVIETILKRIYAIYYTLYEWSYDSVLLYNTTFKLGVYEENGETVIRLLRTCIGARDNRELLNYVVAVITSAIGEKPRIRKEDRCIWVEIPLYQLIKGTAIDRSEKV